MTDEAMSPLRRRMIEDMTIRKLAPKTQRDYVQRINNFAAFLGRSPDTASFDDVRRYQLHLASSGVGVATINQTLPVRPLSRSSMRCRPRSTGSTSVSSKSTAPMRTANGSKPFQGSA